MLPRLQWAATLARLTAEVLVNSDSRHVRDGDAPSLVAALGEADSLLLTPNTHELRAYNRLALGLSRGDYLVFVQDDTRPPLPSADVRWLTRSVALFLRWPQVGSVSLNAGLFFVSNYSEQAVGVQVMDDLPGKQRLPVCDAESDRDGEMVPGVEAIRCADVGPLLVRRTHFVEVGGFNETGTARGEPGSVNVDCELQARLWLRGRATLFNGLVGAQRWEHQQTHRAWEHPAMRAGHARRMTNYYNLFEVPGSAERLAIERAARAMNAQFHCPTRERLRRQPRTRFDCYVVEAKGTCQM